MFLYRLTFGTFPTAEREAAVDVVENYISVLLNNGQAVGEYVHLLQNGKLCAYLNVSGIYARSRKFHCRYGRARLKEVIDYFGSPPEWELLDDETRKRDRTWANAPFLYLFTYMGDWESPLCRGDNGKPIPLYRLPGSHEDRAGIYHWQLAYRDHDAIWMGCRALEVPAYKQLCLPDSELSREGREICREVEKTTGVPTYYFLKRYWGRRQDEEKRKCPGCGRSWRTTHPIDTENGFWCFPFRCDTCRLVSHMADSCDDDRHASIGEWKTGKKRRTKGS